MQKTSIQLCGRMCLSSIYAEKNVNPIFQYSFYFIRHHEPPFLQLCLQAEAGAAFTGTEPLLI